MTQMSPHVFTLTTPPAKPVGGAFIPGVRSVREKIIYIFRALFMPLSMCYNAVVIIY